MLCVYKFAGIRAETLCLGMGRQGEGRALVFLFRFQPSSETRRARMRHKAWRVRGCPCHSLLLLLLPAEVPKVEVGESGLRLFDGRLLLPLLLRPLRLGFLGDLGQCLGTFRLIRSPGRLILAFELFTHTHTHANIHMPTHKCTV